MTSFRSNADAQRWLQHFAATFDDLRARMMPQELADWAASQENIGVATTGSLYSILEDLATAADTWDVPKLRMQLDLLASFAAQLQDELGSTSQGEV